MRDPTTFSLALVASGAKDLTRLPLACLLADYCEREGIDQSELMSRRFLNCSPESLKRLATVTVDVGHLIKVLQGTPARRPRGRPRREETDHERGKDL